MAFDGGFHAVEDELEAALAGVGMECGGTDTALAQRLNACRDSTRLPTATSPAPGGKVHISGEGNRSRW